MDWSPILISLRTAAISIIITFFLGISAALFVMKRGTKVKILLDGIFTLPLVLPPTVAGFFLLELFGINGSLGKLFLKIGIRIIFTWQAAVIAAVVISLPLMYRSARAALEQVDENLVFAGRTLGMSESRILYRIRLPLAFPGIASGGILAFARGLGEFGATIMIAGNIKGVTQTIPLAIYSSVQAGDMKQAYTWVAIIVVLSLVIIILMNYYTVKSQKYRGRRGRR